MSFEDDVARRMAALEREIERLKTREPAGHIIGEIKLWTTDTAPGRWLLCYGQAVSRTTYAALFAVIGTTYGSGDGSTTFNVPDLRGRVPLGQDDMGGSSANRVTASQADNLGQGSGAETHTLTESEMPSHTHTLTLMPYGTGGSAQGSINNLTDTTNQVAVQNQSSITSTGGGAAHNNMPPYVTLNFIIFAGG